MNVFTYGTLCIPEVMTAVCGRRPDATDAQLSDYACHLIVNQNFPGIQPQPGGIVPGLLWSDISTQELEALDAFECDFYNRLILEVKTKPGIVEAMVYVVAPQHLNLISGFPWDEAFFIQHHLATYL